MTRIGLIIEFCGQFEAELLTELMLRHWGHPLCSDADHRNALLELATEVLHRSEQGEKLMSDVPPASMNFVAAVWYAEWTQLAGVAAEHAQERQAWLETVRRALPSCFCDPGDVA